MLVFFFLAYFTMYHRLQFHPPHLNWLKYIRFNGWVIFHCVYVPQLSFPFICWWISRLLPCPGYYKQCFDERYWRRQWHPTPVLLSGKSHGRRSLVGCSPWGRLRVRHDWVTSFSLFTFTCWRRKWQPTPVFLPGESQGQRSMVGCRLWGHTESDTTEAT